MEEQMGGCFRIPFRPFPILMMHPLPAAAGVERWNDNS
jgi:hypothetical protein